MRSHYTSLWRFSSWVGRAGFVLSQFCGKGPSHLKTKHIRNSFLSYVILQFSSVQSFSHVWLFVTPWIAARQASLSIINSRSSLRLMSIESVMPSNHLILCRPFLFLPSIFPSIRIFSNESALHIRWPRYWSFSFSISPSNEYSGLISFRMDWLDLLASQGTLKSLFQHHSSKHQFFGAQPSLWYSFHVCTWLLEKPFLWLYRPLSAKWCLCFLIWCLGLSQLFFQGLRVF